jgi:hypothetical protein
LAGSIDGAAGPFLDRVYAECDAYAAARAAQEDRAEWERLWSLARCDARRACDEWGAYMDVGCVINDDERAIFAAHFVETIARERQRIRVEDGETIDELRAKLAATRERARMLADSYYEARRERANAEHWRRSYDTEREARLRAEHDRDELARALNTLRMRTA